MDSNLEDGRLPDGTGLPMNGAAKASPPSVGIPDAESDLEAALGRLGERLRERRKAMKLTLDAVAERSGLVKSYVWEIENSKNKNPTIRTAWKLAHALGWTLSECIGVWEHTDLLHPEAMRVAIIVDNAIAQAMSAGTAKTAQPVEGEARQRGPEDAPRSTSSSRTLKGPPLG